MPLKLISQGAEAKIFLSNKKIIKDRIKKSYRIPELDTKIRKQRTKAETKLLAKASKIINTPIPEEMKDINKIKMPFIDGKKLSEHLDKFPLKKQKQILKQIGQDIAKLHDNQIIHGDLTTSNMILVLATKTQTKINKTLNLKKGFGLITSSRRNLATPISEQQIPSVSEQIYFIDFGLGFISQKYEDKAVDIHLLKQALEAKHFTHWEILFKEFLKGYKKSKDFEKTINQLNRVEKRGRYKH